MKNSIIEIEINDERNRGLMFRPLKRGIRGRFELRRFPERLAMGYADKCPDTPGQHLRLDLDKREGAIIEPIHSDKVLTLFMEKHKFLLPPQVQTFANIDADEWAFWMKQAVQLKLAVIVEGTFPEVINYVPPEDPRRGKPKRGEDRKREIFRADPATAMDYLKLPAEKRHEWEQMVGV